MTGHGMTHLQVVDALYPRAGRTIFAAITTPPVPVANGPHALPPPGVGAQSFAYEHTDVQPGMTLAQWAMAGHPIQETAPALLTQPGATTTEEQLHGNSER